MRLKTIKALKLMVPLLSAAALGCTPMVPNFAEPTIEPTATFSVDPSSIANYNNITGSNLLIYKDAYSVAGAHIPPMSENSKKRGALDIILGANFPTLKSTFKIPAEALFTGYVQYIFDVTAYGYSSCDAVFSFYPKAGQKYTLRVKARYSDEKVPWYEGGSHIKCKYDLLQQDPTELQKYAPSADVIKRACEASFLYGLQSLTCKDTAIMMAHYPFALKAK